MPHNPKITKKLPPGYQLKPKGYVGFWLLGLLIMPNTTVVLLIDDYIKPKTDSADN